MTFEFWCLIFYLTFQTLTGALTGALTETKIKKSNVGGELSSGKKSGSSSNQSILESAHIEWYFIFIIKAKWLTSITFKLSNEINLKLIQSCRVVLFLTNICYILFSRYRSRIIARVGFMHDCDMFLLLAVSTLMMIIAHVPLVSNEKLWLQISLTL
jgi:hypothetical protein